MAGTVIALELQKKSDDEIILLDCDSLTQSFDHNLNLEKRFNQKVEDLQTTGYGYGGSSNLWHGVLTDLDKEDYLYINKVSGRDIHSELHSNHKYLKKYFGETHFNANSRKKTNQLKNYLVFSTLLEKIYTVQSYPTRFRKLLVKRLKNIDKENYYLIALESPLIDNAAISTKYHDKFNKIFTWNDDLIDDKKYFKVNDAFVFPSKILKEFDGKKLCCIIAGNKHSKYPNDNELYTKKVAFIRWFEKHHIGEFDLYGTGWDDYSFGHSFLGRVLNKIKVFNKKGLFPSYMGKVESKNDIMRKYKFSICYENVMN